MDNQRLLIWATFGFLLWMTWQAWQQDYAPATVPQQTTPSEQVAMPQADDSAPALPQQTADAPAIGDQPPALDDAPEVVATNDDEVIRVTTDVFDLAISTRGGTLTRAALLNYPVTKDEPDNLVVLMSPDAIELGLIRTGLNDAGEGHFVACHLVN